MAVMDGGYNFLVSRRRVLWLKELRVNVGGYGSNRYLLNLV